MRPIGVTMAEMVLERTIAATGIIGPMVINMISCDPVRWRRWNLIWTPLALRISTIFKGIKTSLVMMTILTTVGLRPPDLK